MGKIVDFLRKLPPEAFFHLLQELFLSPPDPTRYWVKLLDFGPHKIRVIRALRSFHPQMDILEAKELIQNAPTTFPQHSEGYTKEEAGTLLGLFLEAGSSATISPPLNMGDRVMAVTREVVIDYLRSLTPQELVGVMRETFGYCPDPLHPAAQEVPEPANGVPAIPEETKTLWLIDGDPNHKTATLQFIQDTLLLKNLQGALELWNKAPVILAADIDPFVAEELAAGLRALNACVKIR